MTIQFKQVELKAFPKLPLIENGLTVIALNGSDYEGLKGIITKIQYGEAKETENETILDIYVDFEEPKHSDIESTHPHLNGTSISQVICGEDELGYLFKEEDPFPTTADGKAVCPHCFEGMTGAKETQYDDISWSFVDGEYRKNESYGSSDGKRCGSCEGVIEDINEQFFIY